MIDEKRKNKHLYSNIGYHILGVLIEKISKITYSDFVRKNILLPLNMKNTGTGNTNIILYNSKIKKLSKIETLVRHFASSAGELHSCVKDLIKFSNFTKLLYPQTLKLCSELVFVYKEDKDNIIIHHGGSIYGGVGGLEISYDKNYKFKKIYITLKTVWSIKVA